MIGRPANGVRLIQEAGDELDQFAIDEANEHVAEANEGSQQCHDPWVGEGEIRGMQTVGCGRGPGHVRARDHVRSERTLYVRLLK